MPDEELAVAEPEVTEEVEPEVEPEATPEPPSVEDLLSQREDLSSFIDQRVAEAAERAEQRGRDRKEAEIRRQLRDPQVVTDGLVAIARDLADSGGEISQSVRDRAMNLVSQSTRAALDQVADEIPGVFFGGYDMPKDTLADYHDKMAAGDTDGAFKTLIEAAVSSEVSAREAEIDKRIGEAVEQRVKAELENQENGNGAAPPRVPRGGRSTNPLALTSAELLAPEFQSAIRRLSQEQRDRVYSLVSQADSAHGEDTVRETSLTALEDLINA